MEVGFGKGEFDMKLTKGIGVVATSFLLFLYFDVHNTPMIVVWFVSTLAGAIAMGLEIVERYNNAR